MPIKIYISNDLENLIDQLRKNITNTDSDVFRKDILMVQTDGLSRWISVQLAQKTGIFSNFEFISPNNFINDIFKMAYLRMPEIYSTKNLKWLVFNILGESEFNSLFPDISNYYENDNIKQLQLSTKLSDLFDQYTFFRPDYILNWNQNIDNLVSKKFEYHEKWQKWLWNRIKSTLENEGPDRVEMFVKLLNDIQNDEELKLKISRKYPKISVFGFSVISQLHIDILVEISKSISDIDFYVFSPSPEEYWLHDIPEKTKLKIERYFKNDLSGLNLEVGNKLLMNLGKTARYFYLMLFNNDEFLNNLDNENLVKIPKRESLLQLIQNEIYYNISNDKRVAIPKEIIFDGSLSISSHFTIAREVEALHNYLLFLFENSDVKPQDIIIQTANIDKYVPYIVSVFETSKYKIPYTIADRSYRGADNIAGILEKILTLREDEFTSENIFQLTQYKPIKEKFEFSDTELLRILIDKANIRTGITGNIEDETYIVSWKAGLERILLGFALNSNELYEIPGKSYKTLPLQFIENDFATEGFKLIGFVSYLIEMLDNRKTKRSLFQWKEYIQSVIENLFYIEDTDLNLLQYIYEKLSFPPLIDHLSGDNINYDIFSTAFLESLYQNTRKGNFISGNVTFCSLTPMRSIPFRIVGILGLDFNNFPRKNTESLFDLIRSEHRPGDRNNKESDKYLFLEALLSAKEKIYLSYIGQNPSSNNELPPSNVIDELIDYIFYFENDQKLKEKFITKHPLHNFNSKYFDPEYPELYTFINPVDDQKLNYIFGSMPENISSENTEITVSDIISFYKNSIEWYFKKELKINYRENEILIPETELFDIDNLNKHILSFKLLEIDEEKEMADFILKEKIKGNLPLKSVGIISINNLLEKIHELKNEINIYTSNSTSDSNDIDVKINHADSIKGQIKNIFNDKLIIPGISKNNAKNLVQFKIYRLLLSISNPEINQYILINKNEEKLDKIILQKIAKKEAEETVKFLIEVFQNYLSSNFIFTAESALQMHKSIKSSRSGKSPEIKYLDALKIKSEYDYYTKKYLEINEENKIIDSLNSNREVLNKLLYIFLNDIKIN